MTLLSFRVGTDGLVVCAAERVRLPVWRRVVDVDVDRAFERLARDELLPGRRVVVLRAITGRGMAPAEVRLTRRRHRFAPGVKSCCAHEVSSHSSEAAPIPSGQPRGCRRSTADISIAALPGRTR